MISDGVIILQRLPSSLSVAMDRPPSYFGSHRSVPSNLLTMTHRWLAPIGHSNCYYRNTESLLNFNHLMIQLMKQFHFCDEEEKKTQRGGIPVGRSQSIANTLNFNKEDRPSSQVSDKLNKSDPIENDTKKKKSCNATATTQEICQDKNTTSLNTESSWQSGGNTSWQISVNVSGCDEVRAFTESGVLNVEGRRNKREQQQQPVMKVQHRTTLPIGVDPETLTATLTKDGLLIVSQRKGQYGEGDVTELNKPTNDDVTELNNPTDDDVTELNNPTDDDVTELSKPTAGDELSQLTSGDVTELNNINKENTVDKEKL